MKQTKVPGIMGGMGPGATRDLYDLIIQNTAAGNDQEHLEILIHSHPHLDRTSAILNQGKSPLPTLVLSAKKLQKAGADFLAVPCNTAHFFITDIQKTVDIDFVDMITETKKEIVKNRYKTVGLLATTGTIQSKLYQNKITNEILVPTEKIQQKVMVAIYGERGIKANVKHEKADHNKKLLVEAINELKKNGAEAIIMGCTEIPLCLEEKDTDLPLINPTLILARAIVKQAISQEKMSPQP